MIWVGSVSRKQMRPIASPKCTKFLGQSSPCRIQDPQIGQIKKITNQSTGWIWANTHRQVLCRPHRKVGWDAKVNDLQSVVCTGSNIDGWESTKSFVQVCNLLKNTLGQHVTISGKWWKKMDPSDLTSGFPIVNSLSTHANRWSTNGPASNQCLWYVVKSAFFNKEKNIRAGLKGSQHRKTWIERQSLAHLWALIHIVFEVGSIAPGIVGITCLAGATFLDYTNAFWPNKLCNVSQWSSMPPRIEKWSLSVVAECGRGLHQATPRAAKPLIGAFKSRWHTSGRGGVQSAGCFGLDTLWTQRNKPHCLRHSP